jgi:hypothetical protein
MTSSLHMKLAATYAVGDNRHGCIPAEFVRRVMVVVVVYSGEFLIHNTYGYVSDDSAK